MTRLKFRRLAATLIFMCFLVINSINVYAIGGEVTFGSEEYTEEEDSKFFIGVYVSTTDRNQDYHIELKYDNKRMSYIKGGESEEDGIITLEGSGLSSTRKYMLSFETLSGGNSYISVVDGYTCNADGTNRQSLDELKSVNVFIEGEDTVGETEEETEEPELEETQVVAADRVSPVNDVVSTQTSVEQKESESSNEMVLETNFLETVESTIGIVPMIVGTVCIFLAIMGIVAAVVVKHSKKRRRNRELDKEKRALRHSKYFSNNVDVEDLEDSETVISVQNVTMKFKVATQSVSSIKDYFIQLVKGKLSYRELVALDNINFDVYKGEVMGIIGTNGSGKSTLLKIVSGALRPTEGRVELDRRKVQLLTLGTGFDMELTARENVYLNGAIIGYSRDFLDEHYDEIVEFAELEGFMEEKVKNFSSGMVSRLGFAIATAGDAAEILILDEVLSVGDEFFRKKSLKRVKEMIHGGSTVLLVSHGMGTILENCDRVVWIEKGQMRMIGEPKSVCAAYREMGAGA
ncbi:MULTISPECIES: ABC transporter ATP-binding protein [Pseudobutyrivibrio]|uniref:ABC-type polysaccharide/polyol phosphate transport system, ATPase component n=1 Tax=Pseudobutyrivibrio xylanivorans TaxID=185007 RepID=A0A1G5S316_PSEXY|nr:MULTISPECIES: ABC transporter ATP-binding protein [Pseudobutyrivibrio]SCZ80792.1 ABC-type polysaccharide/polyol phosphate transport system, ATPase component [Pseudobutyrivibrio xylanivorans]